MGTITGGRVNFKRTVKTGDYEGKTAEVELTFSTEDGVDYAGLLRLASLTAQNQAHAMLGLAPVAAPDTIAKDAAKDAYAAAADAGKKTRTRKPPAVDPATVEEPARTAEEAQEDFDPLADGGEVAPKDVNADLGDPLEGVGDPLESEEAPVTDKELVTSITSHNDATRNTTAIRQLISRYTPQDGNKHQAYEIPAEKRRAFLTELATIKAL